jgi:hypothetical protein
MPSIRPSTSQFLRCNFFARPRWRHPHLPLQCRRLQTVTIVAPPPPTTPKKRRSLKSLAAIYLLTFGAVGLAAGYVLQATFIPPEAPPSGTPEDERMLALLSHDIDNLHIVRTLRQSSRREDDSESVHKDISTLQSPADRLVPRERLPAGSQPLGAQLPPSPGDEGSWIELPIQEPRRNNLTALMKGAGGTGVQRAFWNPTSQELVMIVWFGSKLCGWPGLAHGGAIATLLCEGTKMAAECVSGKTFAGRQGSQLRSDVWLTSLSAAPSLEHHPYDPAMLSLTYVRPTNINNFYVLRARLTSPPDGQQAAPAETSLSPWKDLTKKHGLQEKAKSLLRPKPIELDGALETMEGKVCVKVKTSWNL